MKFNEIYKPATALPFLLNESYIEIEPCRELKPYIKCFWGSKAPYTKIKTDIPSERLIIPDTCTDIIFDINFTQNKINSSFCALDEHPYSIHYANDKNELISVFAIRFYAWGTIFFTQDCLKGSKNHSYNAEYFFPKLTREIKQILFDITDIYERIDIVQKYLLNNIHLKRYNGILNDALAEILTSKGSIKTESLAKSVFTSNRQLERIFSENIGISPKKLSSLIRYQYLWQEILYCAETDLTELAWKYGFSDEAHLLNNFKKFHNMTVSQAKSYAYKNVAFLQDK